MLGKVNATKKRQENCAIRLHYIILFYFIIPVQTNGVNCMTMLSMIKFQAFSCDFGFGCLTGTDPGSPSFSLARCFAYLPHFLSLPPSLSLPHLSPGALTKVKDCPKQEGDLHDRCNIISCATLAEIQHFHRTRVRDFRSQMQHHLQQQIGFFQKITAKLEDALQRYDDDQ